VSDVDGTLLNPQQQLTPGTQQALQAAAEAGVPLVVATGKALGPWRDTVLPRIGSRLPQVSAAAAWAQRAAGWPA
jgi:hydroxymethylpyrimidine pyrophosphatase-like HAD family hydrolase